MYSNFMFLVQLRYRAKQAHTDGPTDTQRLWRILYSCDLQKRNCNYKTMHILNQMD